MLPLIFINNIKINNMELKQETVEEAASRLLYNKYPYHPPQDSGYWKDMFKEGAKWQQERMYSEEDMIAFALFLEIHLPMKPRKTHHQLLEQFKKEIR